MGAGTPVTGLGHTGVWSGWSRCGCENDSRCVTYVGAFGGVGRDVSPQEFRERDVGTGSAYHGGRGVWSMSETEVSDVPRVLEWRVVKAAEGSDVSLGVLVVHIAPHPAGHLRLSGLGSVTRLDTSDSRGSRGAGTPVPGALPTPPRCGNP